MWCWCGLQWNNVHAKFCKTQSTGSTAKMEGHTDMHTDNMVISYTHYVSLMKEGRLKMEKEKKKIAEKRYESKEAGRDKRKHHACKTFKLNFKQCHQSI